jgi:hypothetical protein
MNTTLPLVIAFQVFWKKNNPHNPLGILKKVLTNCKFVVHFVTANFKKIKVIFPQIFKNMFSIDFEDHMRNFVKILRYVKKIECAL